MRRKGYCLYPGIVEYNEAFVLQQEINKARQQGIIRDTVLFLEHHPCFTIGRKGGSDHILVNRDVLAKEGVRVYETDRGGDITYHGPGQLICYPIIDLKGYSSDVHIYARKLEEVVICTLARMGIKAGRRKKYPGVWAGEAKIAAEGITVDNWVTMHGVALNVNTDMKYFNMIVPCGITAFGVISMQELLGFPLSMKQVKQEMCSQFQKIFEIELTDIGLEEVKNIVGKTGMADITGPISRKIG